MSLYQHDTIVPFNESADSKKKQVEAMFDKIAFRYDFLNHFLSAGIDKGWRKKAIKSLELFKPKRILDVATGTGDMAILAHKMISPDSITGIDLSDEMLKIGNKKVLDLNLQNSIRLLKGDSEAIKFDDNTFDAVTVAFGVRNFEDLEKGLIEINRVLKPGGKLVVLEFTKPSFFLVKIFYNFYMKVLTPRMGKMISKNNNAYKYLNESIQKFPERKFFTEILNKLDYKNTSFKTLSLGICSIYFGEK